MLTHPLFPQTFLRLPDAPEGAAAVSETPPAAAAAAPETPPAAEPAAAAAAPETPPAPAAPAPWAKDLEAYVTDPVAREAFDRYMREKQQPYVTQLEQAKSEAEGKAWVFDGLQDDPEATLREIAEQVYDTDTATRIAELLMEGKTVEGAEAQATAEAAAAAPAEDLSKLSPEVREAVEFARAEKARRATEDAEAVSKKELDEAIAEYDTWRADVMTKNPDIVEATLHTYVHAADGDMEQGLANYRAVYPAPESAAATPPATLGGHTTGGIRASRQVSSLGEAFGEVYDAAHKGTTTL